MPFQNRIGWFLRTGFVGFSGLDQVVFQDWISFGSPFGSAGRVFSDRIGSGRFTQRIGSIGFRARISFLGRIGFVQFSKGKEKN